MPSWPPPAGKRQRPFEETCDLFLLPWLGLESSEDSYGDHGSSLVGQPSKRTALVGFRFA